jgi:prevent-host-death family protein
MGDLEPKTRTRTISEVQRELSALVQAVHRGETRVIVEREGVAVAALVPIADLTRLQQFDRDWDRHTRALERFSEAFADVPTEEAEAEVARIIADLRRDDMAAIDRQSA